MLKPGKYLSGKKRLYTFVAETKKKQRIMKHRQFKKECLCKVMLDEKTFVCDNLREAKKKIYRFGTRGWSYEVNVIDKKTRITNDIYLMKYTIEGPIFQKQVYSRWKEEQSKAKNQQLTINILQ